MALNLDAEIAKIEGKYVDLDGAPRQAPYQCHDIWLWLLYLVGGQPGEGYAPDNDTVSVFYRFPYRPRLAQLFTKHDDASGIRKGDVLFWKRGTWYPGSHTAVALGPVVGELVPTLTQNPGPARRANLITRDLVGYLRPIALSDSTSTARRNLLGRLMFNIYVTGPTVKEPNKHARLITDYGSFHIPTEQILVLLLRRRNDTIVAEPTMNVQTIGNQMLDAEHDIINNFLRTCFRSAQTGVDLDPAKFLTAINEGFAQLGKQITITPTSVDVDADDLLAALELAAPRIAAAMVKQAGQKLAS